MLMVMVLIVLMIMMVMVVYNKKLLPDSASLHSCGDGHGFVDVIGEHSRYKTIIGVVGPLYHFLNSLKLHELLDWPKYLQTGSKTVTSSSKLFRGDILL